MDARQVIFTHVPSSAALHCAVYGSLKIARVFVRLDLMPFYAFPDLSA
jgi:hypothetical protein